MYVYIGIGICKVVTGLGNKVSGFLSFSELILLRHCYCGQIVTVLHLPTNIEYTSTLLVLVLWVLNILLSRNIFLCRIHNLNTPQVKCHQEMELHLVLVHKCVTLNWTLYFII
uniref:Uncharacterized protein n=1 Tax=Megaselia scalaris TaxID=36166 RepID=T1GME4_MEGSC